MASVSGQASQFISRGPSPILPPIHNLQSLPERNLSRPGTAFDDTALPRPSSFPREYGSVAHEVPAFTARNRTDLETERQGQQSYMGSSVPPLAYNQPPYDTPAYVHYPQGYRGEPEYSSQMVHNPQHSNFGILGDPIDPRSKRRRGNLPKPVTDILRAWFHEHLDHPYPSEEDKQIFMTRTGLSISQVHSSLQSFVTSFFSLLTLISFYRAERSVIGSLMRDGDSCQPSVTKFAAVKTRGLRSDNRPSAILNRLLLVNRFLHQVARHLVNPRIGRRTISLHLQSCHMEPSQSCGKKNFFPRFPCSNTA